MNKFTGGQMLELLKLRAEQNAFEVWGKPLDFYNYFVSDIWLKTIWTRWYYNGVVDGASMFNQLNKIEENNLAEYQCLCYHFCIKNEKTIAKDIIADYRVLSA
jgi:hypothetical protein